MRTRVTDNSHAIALLREISSDAGGEGILDLSPAELAAFELDRPCAEIDWALVKKIQRLLAKVT